MNNNISENFEAWETILSKKKVILIDHIGYDDQGEFLVILEVGAKEESILVKLNIGGLSYIRLSPESSAEKYWGLDLGSSLIVVNSSWVESVQTNDRLFNEDGRTATHYVVLCDDFIVEILSNFPIEVEILN